MTPILEIEKDLDWRVAEMATLKLLIQRSSTNSRTKQVLLRAAWALLYAHYEGFCKFALSVYYDALVTTEVKICDLPDTTQAYALSLKIKQMRNLPPLDFLMAIKNFDVETLRAEASFPTVDTKSNLMPSLLKELIVDADLPLYEIDLHSQVLATLVRRRNKIAHGERDLIPEPDYYFDYENVVTKIMYALACAISDKLDELNAVAKSAPLVTHFADPMTSTNI